MRALIPNSTQIPDVILDHWMARLSGAEFKVVLYIARRTYGFGKESDTISINQLSRGIRKRDGQQLDSGTGLSRSSVKSACASLVSKGILIKTQSTVDGSDEPDQNTYRLNLYASIEEAQEGEDPGNLGSNDEVGQKQTHLGQKSAHLSGASNIDQEVGQKSTHLGQISTHQGQKSTYRRPVITTGVGQKLAPQETEQETDLQETATGSRLSTVDNQSVAAVFTPSALTGEEDAVPLLHNIGFSKRDAIQIASAYPVEIIRQQIEWLGLRTVHKNKLGMLRKAIEQNWPKPTSTAEERKKESQDIKTSHQANQDARRREIGNKLRDMYSRLKIDAPEAFSAFEGYIQDEKAKQSQRPLIRENPKRLELILSAYETEEMQLEMMVEFFKEREVPLPEFAGLITTIKNQALPTAEYVRHVG